MGNWEMAVNPVFNLPYLVYLYILEYIEIIHLSEIYLFYVFSHFNPRTEFCMVIVGIDSVLLCSVTLPMASCFNKMINFACKPDNKKNLFQLLLVI